MVRKRLFSGDRVLILGAHPDDVEYGMGGTIHKFRKDFDDVTYMVMSSCLEYPPNRGIDEELRAAARLMNIQNLLLLDYPWMEFQSVRGKIRQTLFESNKKLKPDLVFIPSSRDVHQDHEVLSQESFRIFRDVSVIAYEALRSTLNFTPNLFVGLRKEDLNAKLHLLRAYKTQRKLFYFNPDIVKSLAVIRGAMSKERFAEAFEIMRLRI